VLTQLGNSVFENESCAYVTKEYGVPSEIVGAWRGFFELSTITFEVERQRVRNIFVTYAQRKF
jgi:hypothetical protein